MEAVQDREPSAPPPQHIAIIMDGNGRWARSRGLPRAAGHERGAKSVRTAVQACTDLGVQYLTLYAFSSENWSRPRSEVDDLMGLLRVYLKREVADLDGRNVRVRFIGQREGLADDIIKLIVKAEERTHSNSGLVLVIALNYGSHAEIVQAAQRLAIRAVDGDIQPSDITEELFAAELETAEIPNPDLLIRTSGEQRLSNFLLWQSAYTELIFTDVFWPDFSRKSLEEAIAEYHQRERRFGATRG
ncbi:MAG: isoprenyl transferase [Alphaproteobacteria bacterium]|jgi:undecaprenyl diphosphate synthase|nr:isoprenyl transferase [Alphaproteobacteria bacterium]MBT4711596.1 isoprenyl transferase [Alphaproteobacteria bacterium]